jgi:hypothetical protein
LGLVGALYSKNAAFASPAPAARRPQLARNGLKAYAAPGQNSARFTQTLQASPLEKSCSGQILGGATTYREGK